MLHELQLRIEKLEGLVNGLSGQVAGLLAPPAPVADPATPPAPVADPATPAVVA